MNVLTLNFIREDNATKRKTKKMPIKKMSKTAKRKMKRLRKFKQVKVEDEMQVDRGNKPITDVSPSKTNTNTSK